MKNDTREMVEWATAVVTLAAIALIPTVMLGDNIHRAAGEGVAALFGMAMGVGVLCGAFLWTHWRFYR